MLPRRLVRKIGVSQAEAVVKTGDLDLILLFECIFSIFPGHSSALVTRFIYLFIYFFIEIKTLVLLNCELSGVT